MSRNSPVRGSSLTIVGEVARRANFEELTCTQRSSPTLNNVHLNKDNYLTVKFQYEIT